MRLARWFTPLWPGLTQLWFSGAWWGLAIGCGFAWLLNLAVVSTVVWTEWLDPWSRVGVWILLLLVWAGSVTLSFRQLWTDNPEAAAKAAEDLFRRAQREYLTGNWIQAEQLLTQLLALDGKDVNAHLLMASLLRRTGQLAEAAERLRRLSTMDGTEKWRGEIDRERKILEDLYQQLANTPLEGQDERDSAETNSTPINAAEAIKPSATKAA
jgi:tetratricopeptide (TPR) repeat protein